MIKWNSENIASGLLEICEILKRTPKNKELKNYEIVPSCTKTISKYLKEIGYESIADFCETHGFKTSRDTRAWRLSFDELCALYDKFYSSHGYYPNSHNLIGFNNEYEIPTWTVVKKITGSRFFEFCEKFGLDHVKTKSYEEYCKLFIEVCDQIGKVLTSSDLVNNNFGLPSSRWFVSNCPNENVKNYNNFIEFLGYKPKYEASKEFAINSIFEIQNRLGRNLKQSDFADPQGSDIGITTITNHWGTFNKMLKELGLPINQVGMTEKHRPIDELVADIIRLCKEIEQNENRRIISRDDVKNADWCLSPQNYDRWFKQHFDKNLAEFVRDLGFEFNKAGMGMVYTFPNGEITTSKYEYATSNYLRENNITYERNVKYIDFIKDYSYKKMSKDCDYVININDEIWYIEIAGMLDYRKIKKNYDDNIRKRYKKQLKSKEEMLISNKLNYRIIYPLDFNKPIEEVFSFLFEEKEVIECQEKLIVNR